MSECLYCGRYYSPADSIAKNTPVELSNTFCSLHHKDLFYEQLDADKLPDDEIQRLGLAETPKDMTQQVQHIVAGFKLKVQ